LRGRLMVVTFSETSVHSSLDSSKGSTNVSLRVRKVVSPFLLTLRAITCVWSMDIGFCVTFKAFLLFGKGDYDMALAHLECAT
jgi:hypothetical protein